MRYTKYLAGLALAVGMAFPGAATLSARDFRPDYRETNRLRADMARDRVRLNEDLRCGRGVVAAHQARDLARDQRVLNASRNRWR